MMEKLSLVQNKIEQLIKVVILKSRQSQNIDVLCVEKGRWQSTGSTFSQHNTKLRYGYKIFKRVV